jgi:hypothetical protein
MSARRAAAPLPSRLDAVLRAGHARRAAQTGPFAGRNEPLVVEGRDPLPFPRNQEVAIQEALTDLLVRGDRCIDQILKSADRLSLGGNEAYFDSLSTADGQIHMAYALAITIPEYVVVQNVTLLPGVSSQEAEEALTEAMGEESVAFVAVLGDVTVPDLHRETAQPLGVFQLPFQKLDVERLREYATNYREYIEGTDDYDDFMEFEDNADFRTSMELRLAEDEWLRERAMSNLGPREQRAVRGEPERANVYVVGKKSVADTMRLIARIRGMPPADQLARGSQRFAAWRRAFQSLGAEGQAFLQWPASEPLPEKARAYWASAKVMTAYQPNFWASSAEEVYTIGSSVIEQPPYLIAPRNVYPALVDVAADLLNQSRQLSIMGRPPLLSQLMAGGGYTPPPRFETARHYTDHAYYASARAFATQSGAGRHRVHAERLARDPEQEVEFEAIPPNWEAESNRLNHVNLRNDLEWDIGDAKVLAASLFPLLAHMGELSLGDLAAMEGGPVWRSSRENAERAGLQVKRPRVAAQLVEELRAEY